MKKLIIILSVFCFSFQLFAQEPQLLGTFFKGYNNGASSCAHTTEYYIYNNELYFGLCQEETGYEIWKTDGTSEGTKVLKDIIPGSSPGLVSQLFPEKKITKYNGKLYFLGTEGNEENEEEVLWVSEGETSTTIKFGDGNIEANDTNGMHVYEGLLYFYGRNKITNEEGILRTDGTLEGTDLVVDNEEIEIRAASDFRLVNDKVFFFEKKEEFTAEFTVFDMVTGEMTRIDDFIEGDLQLPQWLYNFQGKMLFTTGTIFGKILCETDGTELGTRILFTGQYEGIFSLIRYHDNNSIIFHTNDIEEDFLSRLYFAADRDTAIPIYSPELGNNSEGVRSISMKQIGESLFFEKGDELWRTDGTFEGTEKILDDANLPHKYNENYYYSNNQIANTANQLWSFNEAIETQQVGNENENIIRPFHFTSKISGKLIFLSEHPTDENLYRIHALDLPPNSIFDEKSERTELTLFPNPAQNELTIPLSFDFQNREIELSIQDVSGQVFFNQTMIGSESLSLDLPSDLINGMYFLKITTKDKEAFGKVMVGR